MGSRVAAQKGGKRARSELLNVLWVIPEPSDMTASKEIANPKPRLPRYGNESMPVGPFHDPDQRRPRVLQMLDDLQAEDQVSGPFFHWWIKDAPDPKLQVRVEGAGCCHGLRAEVQSQILHIRKVRSEQPRDDSLATSQVNHPLRMHCHCNSANLT